MDKKETIIKELKTLAEDNRISCTVARQLAEDLQVSPREVGEMCDELNIRIFACELGCFDKKGRK